jgi:hypothetical protein
MAGKRRAIHSVIGMCLVAACGGESTADTTTPEPLVTTTTAAPETTSTPVATTTTTVPETTTTTVAGVEGAAVAEAFRAYFDRIAAADYDGARALSTGTAANYASFRASRSHISPTVLAVSSRG